MEENKKPNMNTNLVQVITLLLKLLVFLILVILLLVIYVIYSQNPKTNTDTNVQNKVDVNVETTTPVIDVFWKAPDITDITDVKLKEEIAYGKDLIVHTAAYFGLNGKVAKNSTNGMNCQNCHLEAGTKVFGNNYSAVFATYPKYRARSGSIENIYKRVNDCFERSLNGKSLDTASREMQAIVAYIHFLGKDVPKGEKPKGSGLKELAFLDRAADPVNGKAVYMAKCQSCHQANGEGQLNSDKSEYNYPPLWGKNSYNDAAGLYRISNFAKFVKYNMPLGVTHNAPQLTDEEAWDVAAFVNSQPRPKKDQRKDWPKIEEKPIDYPFGPYADGFSETQHKYGPFKPIKDKLDGMKKENQIKSLN